MWIHIFVITLYMYEENWLSCHCFFPSAKIAKRDCKNMLLFTQTHWGQVMYISVSKLTIIVSDNGLLPGHYPNQCWNIVDLKLRNKIQWKCIKENAFKNVVCEMAAILPWSHCVPRSIIINTLRPEENNTFSNAFSWMKHCVFWLKFIYFFYPIIMSALV